MKHFCSDMKEYTAALSAQPADSVYTGTSQTLMDAHALLQVKNLERREAQLIGA